MNKVTGIGIVRETKDKCDAILHCNNKHCNKTFDMLESTIMVDGIGGTTWDGAIILYEYLAVLFNDIDTSNKSNINYNIIELGCGAGLCGLLCACHDNVQILMTDGTIDLCDVNVNNFPKSESIDNKSKSTYRSSNISTYELEWKERTDWPVYEQYRINDPLGSISSNSNCNCNISNNMFKLHGNETIIENDNVCVDELEFPYMNLWNKIPSSTKIPLLMPLNTTTSTATSTATAISVISQETEKEEVEIMKEINNNNNNNTNEKIEKQCTGNITNIVIGAEICVLVATTQAHRYH